MSEKWTDLIQEPNPQWRSKPCPVVEVSVTRDGKKPIKWLARVSPKITSIEDNETLVVSLDSEVDKNGVPSKFSEVEIETLEQGGWTHFDLVYSIAYLGLSNEPKFKKKKWSYDY